MRCFIFVSFPASFCWLCYRRVWSPAMAAAVSPGHGSNSPALLPPIAVERRDRRHPQRLR